MYLPAIKDAQREAVYRVGPYFAIVLTDCVSEGDIDYKHAIFVYLPDPHAERPQWVMAVAAEISDMVRDLHKDDPNPPYFLGVFPGTGHQNLGASPDWADLEKFTARGLEVVAEHLNVDKSPVRYIDNQTDD
jgi:hypothetical protein